MIKNVGLFVFCMILVSGVTARASVFDTFGVDAKGIAMGNARTASADDWTATYYNPAGITQTKESAGINLLVAINHLYVKSYGEGLENTDNKAIEGISVGMTHDFLADFVRIGISLYTPLGDTQQQITHYADASEYYLTNKLYFEMLENTTEQQIILPTIAFRVLPFLSIGGGISLFIKSMTYSYEYFPNPLNQSQWYMNISNTQKYTYVANLGILFHPSERFKVGFSYMSADDFPIVGAAFVHLNSGSLPIAGHFTQTIDTILFYSPAHASLGVMYKPKDNLELNGDLEWVGWSSYINNHDVKPRQESYTDPSTGITYTGQGFSDIYIPKLGVAYNPMSSLCLMAGYEYRPTPVPPQMRSTNYVDNVKNVLSTGVSYSMPYHAGHVRFTLDLQGIILGDRKTNKSVAVDADLNTPGIQNPGYPGFESKGYIYDAGISIGYAY